VWSGVDKLGCVGVDKRHDNRMFKQGLIACVGS